MSLQDYTFHAFDGNGTGKLLSNPQGDGCDGVEMSSSTDDGLAASFQSPRMSARPGRKMTATFFLMTQSLIPIPGGLDKGAAALTGGVYLHFFDANGDSGAWNPQFGELAPSDTGGKWVARSSSFVVPTTAVTVDVHVAFAAHTSTYSPNRMTGGRATGRVSIASLTLTDVGAADPLPPTVQVPDPLIQGALEQAFKCLHNSRQSGNFTVGAGYTISGNISPDLTFGLHGIRRTAHDSYVEQISKQWEWHTPDASGKYTAGRVMGQIYWPLGVDNIFSYTGDTEYLKRLLPRVDASIAFVHDHSDENGLATLVPLGQGHMGGGADWVDWYGTRLQGRTFNFHQWYVRTLQRFSQLHAEFKNTFGNETLSSIYSMRADALLKTLREAYWRGDHWLTNPDYADEGQWFDDTVWSIFHGVANSTQRHILWSQMDGNQSFIEGVPTRWAAFKNDHWYCSWFGRLGAGDIMARYKYSQSARAFTLLQRISSVIAKHQNIYEGYDMSGCGLQKCGCTTSGFGDYLEHCGGLIWAVVEGVFGLDFDSGDGFVATIEPRFPDSWPNASLTTSLRGRQLSVVWHGSTLTLKAKYMDEVEKYEKLLVRVKGCRPPSPVILELESGRPESIDCALRELHV